MVDWIHIIILLPFIFSVVVPLLNKLFTPRIHIGWFVLVAPLFMFIHLITYIPSISSGNTEISSMPWIPSLNINLTTYVDGLSLIFGLLITGIGSLVIFYSIYYLSQHREALHNFYVYILLFMGAMLGLVFSDNILALYVFWEITSISSFLLIAYWFERESSRYGALKSMLITISGGLAMLMGFIMLSMMADTYSIRKMIANIDIIQADALFLPAMILVLLGAFTKSAQFPFSIWLPDAMEAPTPISAYLHSATMVKAGIYLVARLTPIFGGVAEWFWLVSGIGLFTLFYGSINAVKQTDLKALLAYSTISQLGLIMSLLGVGSAALYYGHGEESTIYAAAIFTAIFHLVNHSTFKGCLFMIVGIIDHETGTRDIRRLGGLMRIMPVSFTLMLIGSFSMAGLPPFNGFLSKEMFFAAMLEIANFSEFNVDSFSILFPAIAWIASIFTFVYCMILAFKTFTGTYYEESLDKKPHEAAVGMLLAPTVLALLVIGIFFFPNVLAKYILIPAWMAILPVQVYSSDFAMEISFWHGVNTELMMTIGVVAFGALLYVSLKKWVRVYWLYPQMLTINRMYDFSLEKMEYVAKKITERYMTGHIRDYLVYIFGFIIVIVGGSLFLFDGFHVSLENDAPINIYEIGLVIAMIASAVYVLFSSSRISSIVAVGAVGFLLSFFFVLFRAPDLALTQLVVETVTTALFLLCFYHLPQLKKEISRIRFKLVNAIIAVGAGVTVTLVALSANSARLFDSISSFYENSYELAGGRNIVNVILVDFRGFDTMLEILVLTTAGLGVYTLIKLRLAGGKKNEGTK